MALQIVSSNRYVINNDGAVAPASQPKTFNDAAESYIANGGEARYLRPIVTYFADRPLSSIYPFDVQEMAKALFPNVKNATLNRQALTPVRAVINHAYDRGWRELIRLKNFKQQKPKDKVPASALWVHLFVRQCEKEGALHVAGLILFMSQTGARVSEAVALQWPEVDIPARTALLLKTKTETNSTRHLTDVLVTRLQALRHQRSKLNPNRVFHYKCRFSVNERIRTICSHAEIEYKPSHVCGRYTYANTAIAMGVDIATAMAGGGWKSSAVFLGTYVKARRNSGRIVADHFNQHQFDGEY